MEVWVSRPKLRKRAKAPSVKPLLPVCGDFMVILWCGVIKGVRLRIFDLWFRLWWYFVKGGVWVILKNGSPNPKTFILKYVRRFGDKIVVFEWLFGGVIFPWSHHLFLVEVGSLFWLKLYFQRSRWQFLIWMTLFEDQDHTFFKHTFYFLDNTF